VFVNLAWEESFALPVVEAMSSGTPVVASRLTALPEIVADGGLTVDPQDLAAVARTVRSVLDDADLRADLTARGVRRSADFSWDKSAREMAAVYAALRAGRRS